MTLSREQLNDLYRYALSLTGDSDDAYDLLQSVIEKQLSKQSNVEIHEGYIRTSIRNLFIDNCRRRKIVAFEPLEDDTLTILSTEPLEKVIIDENLVEHLTNALEPGERECLYLWAVLGYTADEIAQETGETRGTILSRLFRLKKKAQKASAELMIPNQNHSEASGE